MLKGIHQQLDPQDTPAFFVQGPRPFSRLMVFCAASLVMMAVDARFDYLNRVRQGFSAALHPLEVVARAPNEWGRNIDRYFTAHHRLIQENVHLKQQALIDHAALQRLATVDLENQHLRSLLKGDQPRIPDAVLGEVLHMGRDPFSNILTINRGSRDQIVAGQAVVDGEGVVGQITRVYPYTSEVTLITDKKLSIPIQIERNQLRAIAFGEGKRNTLDIPFLPTSVDIKVGDKLVTSGIDGVYPAGLAVAQVTQIKQSQDSPFAKIISRPIAGVNNHKHVLILKLPETVANNPGLENRPAMPRSSTQHLDQAVVDVLQKENAKMDPVPPNSVAPADAAPTPVDPAPDTPAAEPNATTPTDNRSPASSPMTEPQPEAPRVSAPTTSTTTSTPNTASTANTTGTTNALNPSNAANASKPMANPPPTATMQAVATSPRTPAVTAPTGANHLANIRTTAMRDTAATPPAIRPAAGQTPEHRRP